MESIYYVLCWHCHRRCKHCYESRFHPYVRDELEAVVSEAERNAPRIVDHLPERMTYLDRNEVDEHGQYVEKTGRIILSGGEVLTDPVRERILYPTLERLNERYRDNGGVQLVIQTTGDLLTEKIIDELLARRVWMISIAGMDDYHVGMEGSRREPLQDRLTRWLEAAG
ncbi:MAG: radical SAM protein, partial [Pseudomonadota bacterium]